MKILVLGGAGYIGSHTVYRLIESGNEVVVFDNLETGHIEAVHPKAKFYKGDLRNRSEIDSVFDKEKGIDAVIHFAANSLVGESMTKRTPILETDPTNPTNCYGETKKSMERMFYWVEKAHGLRYVSLRYFNACGAHISGKIGEAHSPETHLIPIILQAAQGTRDHISIFGTDYPTSDGTCIRDYIHVTDLAQAHILAVEYLMKGGKSDIFNLGNGVGYSVREVIETARKVTGRPIPVTETSRRAGDPARLVASSEKAKRILGWKPVHNCLEEIIASAWNWHKKHPNGYDK